LLYSGKGVNRPMRETSLNYSKHNSQQPKYQGGEKKVMKKSLSLLLAIALVISMFGSMAYAADNEMTTQQKYEALAAKGIFAGINGEAALDKNMNRAQFARVAALILGLEGIGVPDTKVVTEKPFSDVELGTWYVEEIAAVKEAELFVGNADGTFNPKGDITVQQLAVVVAGLLNLEPVADATVEGAAAWAAGYIKAIQNAGVDFPTNYTKPATRADLASLAFAADQVINPAESAVQGIVSATAVGAKKIEVKFAKAADADKAAVSLKKGTINTNIKETTFSDDKKTATIELAGKLTKGEYTVTVSGLTETALTKSFTADDEKVTKIEFQSLNAPYARGTSGVADTKNVYVYFKISNQYTEDVTSQNTLIWAISKGTHSVDYGKGIVTINSGTATDFMLNEQISIQAMHAATQTHAQAVVVVSEASRVDAIVIKELHHAEGKTPTNGAEASEWSLIVEAKDKYGNNLTNLTHLNEDLIVVNFNPLVFPSFPDRSTTNVFKSVDNKVAIGLSAGKFSSAGTAKVSVSAVYSGKKAEFDIVVVDSKKVDSLTISPPSVVASGDNEIEVPFTAIDQNGEEVKDIGVLQSVKLNASQGVLEFKRDYAKGVNKLLYTARTNKTLTYTDVPQGLVVVSAFTETNKFTSSNFEIREKAYPAAVAGVKDFDKTQVKTDSKTLKLGNVIVHDQYGREIDMGSQWGTYQVAVESGSGSVVVSGDTLSVTGTVYGLDNAGIADEVYLAGNSKGSSNVTLKLYKTSTSGLKEVSNGSFAFSAKVVEKGDFASYEVEDIATLHARADGGAGHEREVKVFGVLSNGEKVKLPANRTDIYTATTEGSNVVFNPTTSKIHAKGNATGSNFGKGTEKDSADTVVLFQVNGANQPVVIAKTVKVDEGDPYLNSISYRDTWETYNKLLSKENNELASISKANIGGGKAAIEIAVKGSIVVNGYVKGLDQYGFEKQDSIAAISSANISVYNVSTTDRTIGATTSTLVAGDTFWVTVTVSGKFLSFKVIVTE